jgi:hypothetical protein
MSAGNFPFPARDVGSREVSAKGDTGASNHPQSLWITLWVGSGRESQVAYRKGFFFGRSKFERSVFNDKNQCFTACFPLEPRGSRSNDKTATGGLTGGG